MEPGTYKGYLKGEKSPIRVIATIYNTERVTAMVLTPHSLGWRSYNVADLTLFPQPINRDNWPIKDFWWERAGWSDPSWNWVHAEKSWHGIMNEIYWKVGGTGSKWRRKLGALRGTKVTDDEFRSVALERR